MNVNKAWYHLMFTSDWIPFSQTAPLNNVSLRNVALKDKWWLRQCIKHRVKVISLVSLCSLRDVLKTIKDVVSGLCARQYRPVLPNGDLVESYHLDTNTGCCIVQLKNFV